MGRIRSYGLGLGFEHRNGWVGCGTSQRNDVLYHLFIICMVYNIFPLNFWYDILSRGGWGVFISFFFPVSFSCMFFFLSSFVCLALLNSRYGWCRNGSIDLLEFRC